LNEKAQVTASPRSGGMVPIAIVQTGLSETESGPCLTQFGILAGQRVVSASGTDQMQREGTQAPRAWRGCHLLRGRQEPLHRRGLGLTRPVRVCGRSPALTSFRPNAEVTSAEAAGRPESRRTPLSAACQPERRRNGPAAVLPGDSPTSAASRGSGSQGG